MCVANTRNADTRSRSIRCNPARPRVARMNVRKLQNRARCICLAILDGWSPYFASESLLDQSHAAFWDHQGCLRRYLPSVSDMQSSEIAAGDHPHPTPLIFDGNPLFWRMTDFLYMHVVYSPLSSMHLATSRALVGNKQCRLAVPLLAVPLIKNCGLLSSEKLSFGPF